MTTLLISLLIPLVLAELLKGLSANGTPPILQSFRWQMGLAWIMWTNIGWLRVAFWGGILAALALSFSWLGLGLTLALGLIWFGIYWIFNHYWVGRVKFLPIEQKLWVTADENDVAEGVQVIGLDINGVQKAFPVAMLFYHHQISDEVGGQPVWATYCGLCRSGRVYDAEVGGEALDFTLIGAITYNAVFRDRQTGTWWRQETGEAAKGKLAGTQLKDIWAEQMSLQNWLSKHPDSLILQYDPKFMGTYQFLTKLLAYEASLPGWHRQETPPLVIGLEVAGQARAYDFNELKKRRLVTDQLAQTPLLILSDGAESAFAYDRSLEGQVLDFELADEALKDLQTGSTWDLFGRCTAGKLQGKELRALRSYPQFLRSWIDFHAHTTFYEF